jgi:hypothetical protein
MYNIGNDIRKALTYMSDIDVVNNSSRAVILSSFSFLAALAFRDTITTIWDYITQKATTPKELIRFGWLGFGLKLLFFVLVLGISIIISVWWPIST